MESAVILVGIIGWAIFDIRSTYLQNEKLKSLDKRIDDLEKSKCNSSMVFAKRGDFVYIPENMEITGIGIYEKVGDELKLVNKKFIEDK